MNLQQLNRILTGSFIKIEPQQTESVQGYRLSSDEGGTIKRRHPDLRERYIIPGLSDGRRWTKRKKKRTTYKNEYERKLHDLMVDRHVGKKRMLDLEPQTGFLAEKRDRLAPKRQKVDENVPNIAKQINEAKGKALRQKVAIATAVRDINEDIQAKQELQDFGEARGAVEAEEPPINVASVVQPTEELPDISPEVQEDAPLLGRGEGPGARPAGFGR